MYGRKVSAGKLFRVLGLLILTACGCADVRVVQEKPHGGVIALPMNSNCWPMYYRDRAEKLMNEKCPGGFRIDGEEYVWNGIPGPEGHRYHDSYFGYTNPDDETAPYLRKEFRITFHAAPPPARPPAPAPPSPSQGGDREELPPPRPLKSVQK